MPKIILKGDDGSETMVEFTPGMTLMQTIYESGTGELLALCGGVCSCGTCHVYIDENSSVKLSDLPAMSEDEDLLLDASVHRKARSRLSCQLPMRAEYDQLCVIVAPND